MPRLTASRDLPAARPTTRAAPRGKAKKSFMAKDRLKARTLFFRRVKRSLQPGLWLLGGIIVVALAVHVVRKFAASNPVQAVSASTGHGIGNIAAAAGLQVKQIEILGAGITSPEAISAALGVAIGQPIFSISLPQAAARIAQLGPVQSAVVQRALPSTIIVTITERAPYAIWQAGSGKDASFVLIDKSGNIIANQDAAAAKRHDPGLLLLAGADAPQNAAALIDALNMNPVVLANVAAAQRVDSLRWNLVLKNQTLVKLPADNADYALAQLAVLQSSMKLLERPVEVIDLRIPGRLVIQPYPQAAPVMPANPAHQTEEPSG